MNYIIFLTYRIKDNLINKIILLVTNSFNKAGQWYVNWNKQTELSVESKLPLNNNYFSWISCNNR